MTKTKTTRVSGRLERHDNGEWWLTGLPTGYDDQGPYASQKEGREALRGFKNFIREATESGIDPLEQQEDGPLTEPGDEHLAFAVNGEARAVSVPTDEPEEPALTVAHANGEARVYTMIDAALIILHRAKGSMKTRDMITDMQAQALWTTATGKTPWQTLSAAMNREIASGSASRFARPDRGAFTLTKAGHEAAAELLK